MPKFPKRRLPYPAVPITRATGWLFMSTALVAAAVSPPPAFAAADTTGLLAGEAPVADLALAGLRGGFMTQDGMEISFGFRIDLGLDDRLGLSMELDPLPDLFAGDGHQQRAGKPGRQKPGPQTHGSRKHDSWNHARKKQVTEPAPMLPGEVKLTLKDLGADVTGGASPLAVFGLGADGSVEVLSGTPDVTEIAGGKRYDFGDDLIADVVETAGGVTVATAGGNVPVQVARTADGVGLAVGDEAGTRIVDRITPSLLSSRLTNRRDGAEVDHQMTFDINLLNFNELSAGRKTMQSGRHMRRLVDRELVRMMALPR